MSKKKNKISVNTLEKYCDQLNLSPQEIQMPYGDGRHFLLQLSRYYPWMNLFGLLRML